MAAKNQRNGKIDWNNIKISVIPGGPPNPANPYSSLSPEARLRHLQSLYQQIYLRIIEKDESSIT